MGFIFMKLSASSSSVSLSLMLLLVLVFSRTMAVVKLPPNVTIPALIVFGDSIMDTGNNNNLTTLVKCNFPPYGEDFKQQNPTGRFCNGKVPSDLIAEEIGVKELLPAYLDPRLQPSDLITGVCFASGGSGFDPATPKTVSVLSLSDQLELFKEYIGKLKRIVGEERTKFILANSIYLVVSGSDDIANTYFTLRFRQLQYDVPAYTNLMATKGSEFIKDIYELGARRIGIFSAPPIGCVPSQRTLGGGILRGCADKYNEAALLFNNKLSTKLESLRGDLPNSKLVYIDVYNPLLDIIVNPQNYGLKIVDKGCCGTGVIEVAVLCNRLDTTCSDVTDYVFWDSYHPTEKTYRSLVPTILQKYLNQFF
ncbi:GDSL esterase/lipase [Quillaja saponaria]|uniref:GDSL esterase/lipase n=1 Tax=Quillaja saponaria TaxID=32244 RepID=A0AAD7PT26_QUISA|nr:GDSL esterase/lipase [Quillaja saponaria]